MEEKIIFKHTIPVQIRFNDVDMMGHVNNAVIQSYFDLGRTSYLYQIFGRLFDDECSMVIASNKTDFYLPVLYNYKVEVKTTVYSLGNKSLKMMQHIYMVETGELLCSCDSVMVCIDNHAKQTTIIPQRWRKLFTDYEGHEI